MIAMLGLPGLIQFREQPYREMFHVEQLRGMALSNKDKGRQDSNGVLCPKRQGQSPESRVNRGFPLLTILTLSAGSRKIAHKQIKQVSDSTGCARSSALRRAPHQGFPT